MKKILVLIMCLLAMPIAFADYYADVVVDVDSAGFVSIEGDTDYPGLLVDNSEIYTSKDKGVWTLRIEKEEVFSDFFVVINLPSGSSLNYAKTSGTFRIESEKGLSVKSFGSNEPLSVVIQYQITKKGGNYVWYVIGGLFVIGIVVYYFMKKRSKKEEVFEDEKDEETEEKKIKEEEKEEKKEAQKKIKRELDEDRIKAIKPTLNENQIKILDALLEKKGEASQTAIKYMTEIPKSSLSRNVELMAQKNIILKFYNGTSNFIKIHPSLYKEVEE